MNSKLYPLQFNPILKERIWGGTKLKTVLNKPITSDITGESWELSTVEGDISVIANGHLSGKSLTEIINDFPNELLGTEVYSRFGKQFPLLFKFLDAREDLSIQVHPNDELAQKRHHSFGKTEMWYIMQADENARIIVGFKEKSNATEYIKNLENKSVLSILNDVKAKAGDVFFLETGTVHAIGAGLVVAEIQQTSNEIVNCNYFTTNFIPLDGIIPVNKNGKSFTVYMCVDGNFEIEANETSYHYKKGDTVLIPAAVNQFKLVGKGSVLEIYIS